MTLALCFISFNAFSLSAIWNIHSIEKKENGFEIFRYGLPSKLGVQELCLRGIKEVMILSGNAGNFEWKYKEFCPGLKVVYNIKQTTETTLSPEFLQFFDEWVENAQKSGKKIAFRCDCGCHRTGRLAAYYQMKYQNLNDTQAIEEMNKNGFFMKYYPELIPQVRDLYSYIQGLPCTEAPQYCISR